MAKATKTDTTPAVLANPITTGVAELLAPEGLIETVKDVNVKMNSSTGELQISATVSGPDAPPPVIVSEPSKNEAPPVILSSARADAKISEEDAKAIRDRLGIPEPILDTRTEEEPTSRERRYPHDWIPTHQVRHVDGNSVSVYGIMAPSLPGRAYTLTEWVKHEPASFEQNAKGEWLFKGEPFDGAIGRMF